MTQVTLTIGGRTFRTGAQATTPCGAGLIIGLDPFGEEEIGVQLAEGGHIMWFSFYEVNTPPLAAPPASLDG